MKIRILTSVVAIAVFIAILLAPPVVFTIALAAVTLFMLYECYSATKADAAMKIVGFASAAILGAAFMLTLTQKGWGTLLAAMILIVLINMAFVVVEHGKRNYKDVLSNAFLTLYIVFSMSCILMLKEYGGILKMLLIFITAWSTDTFAYFSGRFFGKHKLIPNVSPNKTVEGAIGGVVGAIIVCFIYLCIAAIVVDGASIKGIMGLILSPLINAVIIGGIGAIWSQVGDLVASSIKRDTGIKDFGWIFPGHGGFMDRFDSVIFIAPIILGLLLLIW